MSGMFDGLFAFFKILIALVLILGVAAIILAAPKMKSGVNSMIHKHESINQRVTDQKFCSAVLTKSPHVRALHKSNFDELVTHNPKPVVGCYFVESSDLCAKQLEDFEAVAKDFGDDVTFVAGDVAEMTKSCTVLELERVPAIIVVPRGNKFKKIEQEYLPTNELKTFVKNAL